MPIFNRLVTLIDLMKFAIKMKLGFQGQSRFNLVLAFLFSLGLWLTLPESTAAQQPKTRVTLGIKPDYWFTKEGTGVRVKGIVKATAAERAQLKKNDIILAFDQKAIKNIFTYRDLLSEYKSGDKVILKVKRDGKILLLNAQFD